MAAIDDIRATLEDFGLGALADWAWTRYTDGASIEQIMRDVYSRPEFKAVYPEYDILAAKGRAVSVNDLQYYRRQIVGMFRAYGIPESFYDTPEELAAFAANEISPSEMSQRVALAAEAVFQSSPLMRAEMERLYGVGQGDLIAYFLDPAKAEPIIKQNWVSAQIAGTARQTGYGTLTADEAQRLGQQGIDVATATKGFTDLAANKELFDPLNQGEDVINRDVQLGAALENNATDQQIIERRRANRQAEFDQGGRYATTQQGIVGV